MALAPTKPNYPRIATYCNIWRNYGDIQDSWASLKSVITFYGQDTHRFIEVAAPGSFNDPDMVSHAPSQCDMVRHAPPSLSIW